MPVHQRDDSVTELLRELAGDDDPERDKRSTVDRPRVTSREHVPDRLVEPARAVLAANHADNRHAPADAGAPGHQPTGQAARTDGRQTRQQRGSDGAVIARMRTYARERVANGVRVTGAELDRTFGTRDYGRRVLRQLAAELQPGQAPQA